MAVLPVLVAKLSGTTINYTPASAGGDQFPAHPRGTFRVKNGDAASKTVTVGVPGTTEYGQPNPPVAVVVAAGAEAVIGPFPNNLRDPLTGNVGVTYSAITAVTVAYTTV